MASRKKLYELTDEHRAQMQPWAQRWIANAMSTATMTEVDRDATRLAIRGLYEAANLQPPPTERVVFVPSPFVARFAGGFAAAIWYLRRQNQNPAQGHWAATEAATRDATRAATGAATGDAVDEATLAATWGATVAATVAATRDAVDEATVAATWGATRAATWAATWEATVAATVAATRDAVDAATGAATWDAVDEASALVATPNTPDLSQWFTGVSAVEMRKLAVAIASEHAQFLLGCAHNAGNMCNGGNQYSGDVAWLSFFRYVAQLPLDYSKWQHYEAACVHSGPRVMHAEFCIVSDRPIVLKVDGQNRPHCEDGPFCAWRDGTALWAWHGVRVPAWVITNPERVTVAHIHKEQNAEIRRVLLERYGYERFVLDSGAKAVHSDDFGTLYRTEFPDDEPLVCVSVLNSTPEPDGSTKRYARRVPPDTATAHAAVAWSFGLKPSEYRPVIES